MKQIFIFLLVCGSAYHAAAQVSVTTDGSSPDASAMLDVKSSNKGMLVPRLTTALRIAIPAPADGLLVYDTDSKSFWYFKTGTGWQNLAGASLWEANGSHIFNTNTGNIGMGTNNPLMPLTLRADGLGFSQESPARTTQIGFYTDDQNAWVQTHTKRNLNFSTNNGITRMLLDTLHNVGIGDFGLQAPTARLDVKGNSAMNNTIYGSNPNITAGNSALTGMSAVYGEMTAANGGNFSAGVRGINRSTTGSGIGVVGYQSGSGWGVYGEAPSGRGVFGFSQTGYGGYFASSGAGTAIYSFGRLTFTGVGEAAGKVLTSDASGNASWQAPGSPSAGTGFKVFASGTTIANAATVTIPFTTDLTLNGSFDDGDDFENATNSYVAPESGFYSFDVMISFQARAITTAGTVNVLATGTGILGSNLFRNNMRFAAGDVLPESVTFSFKTKLAAGDKVSVRVYNSLAGNLLTQGPCQFTGVKLY